MRAHLLLVVFLLPLVIAGCGQSEQQVLDESYLDASAIEAAREEMCVEPVISDGVKKLRVADTQRDLRRQGAIEITANATCVFALAPPGKTLAVPVGSPQAIVVRESEFTKAEFDRLSDLLAERFESESDASRFGSAGWGIDAAVGKLVVGAENPRAFCGPIASDFPGMLICEEGSFTRDGAG